MDNRTPEEKADAILHKASETAKEVVHDARGAAQEVLSTAERTAERMVREANTEPTNSELQRNIQTLTDTLREHTETTTRKFNAIDKTLENVATKDDIGKTNGKLDPILDAYKAIILSKSFVTGIAAVVLAIGAIGAGFIWLINSVVKH